MADQESKVPLPQFLKIMTNSGVPVARAMSITGKIYKEYNIPSQLGGLTDSKLAASGLTDKEDRKLVLAAFRKAGYVYKGKTVTKKEAIEKNIASSSDAWPSKLEGTTVATTIPSPSKRKRKYSSDKNEFLPDGPQDEQIGSLEFNEVLDEEQLQNKFCVINRAPIMMAWSTVVAERLGFKRDEALSIASVYTEMNAISKGVSLGVYKEGKDKGMEAPVGGAQPYVELMGRSSLYQTQEGQWRALSNGSPISPGAAFSYISRSFKQTTPYILGALQLLALSYHPKALNAKGWSLYADFRPEVDGWGKRSEVKCEKILNLRYMGGVTPGNPQTALQLAEPVVQVEGYSSSGLPTHDSEPSSKKARTISLDEYDAILDNDTTFDNVNLDFLDCPNRKRG